jgi:hypothetical protein
LLAPGYYLDNFSQLLAAVEREYLDLLLPWEQARLADFKALPRPAQLLYVRLYLRRGPWFLVQDLAYSEIDDLPGAARCLAARGFAALLSCPAEETEALLWLDLLSPERRSAALRALGLPKSGRKEEQLFRLWPHAAKVLAPFPVLCVLDRALFRRAEILFFGNRHQDLSEFVVSDLAHVRYPAYSLSPGERLFPTRSDFDNYVKASSCADLDLSEIPAPLLENVADACIQAISRAPAFPPLRASVEPARYEARLGFRALRDLERRSGASSALAGYAKLAASRAPRGVRVEALERFGLGAATEAQRATFDRLSAALLQDAELNDEERFTLTQRRARLRLGGSPRAALRAAELRELSLRGAGHAGGKALYQGPRGPSTIEQAALALLGGDGLFAENAFYLSLFGLLFWDVIFSPVPGAFVHRFQRGPLDVGGPWFFENRRAAFLARVAALRSKNIGREVREAYEKHTGTATHFVSWEGFSAKQLARSAESLGAPLVDLLDELGRDPWHRGAGLPDLLVHEADGAVLYEVKGPGDQLSTKQRIWHDRLLGLGVRVRLLRVRREG